MAEKSSREDIIRECCICILWYLIDTSHVKIQRKSRARIYKKKKNIQIHPIQKFSHDRKLNKKGVAVNSVSSRLAYAGAK